MPFADGIAPIADRPEGLGDRQAAVVQLAAVSGMTPVFRHVADPGLMRVEPGQEARPGRATAAGVVELGEPQAFRRQLVKGGCLDLTSVTADVGIPDVVRQDHNDVGTGRRGRNRGRGSQEHRDGRESYLEKTKPEHSHNHLHTDSSIAAKRCLFGWPARSEKTYQRPVFTAACRVPRSLHRT
jgi:hypothetical protein